MFFSDIYKSSSVYISTSIHIIRPLSMCLPLRSQQNHPPKPSPCDRHWPIVLPHSREANTFPPRRRRSPPNLIFHSTSRWTTKLSRLHQLHISMNSGNLGHHVFLAAKKRPLRFNSKIYRVAPRGVSGSIYGLGQPILAKFDLEAATLHQERELGTKKKLKILGTSYLGGEKERQQ